MCRWWHEDDDVMACWFDGVQMMVTMVLA